MADASCAPSPLRKTWNPRAEEGVVKLGLQDAYALLGALNNPLGAKFQNAKLNDPKSPLTARNRSILAHGFARVSLEVFERLWEAALNLANCQEADLPSFPKLGERKSAGH